MKDFYAKPIVTRLTKNLLFREDGVDYYSTVLSDFIEKHGNRLFFPDMPIPEFLKILRDISSTNRNDRRVLQSLMNIFPISQGKVDDLREFSKFAIERAVEKETNNN